jgi:nicotinamide mononucleotide adenylyltransferase
MKSFFKFLTEASAAADQAKRLGLAPDGHGGWYNRATGEFEAKTVGGKLQFYNKRQRIPGKDPKQNAREKEIANPNYVDPQVKPPIQQDTVVPADQVDPNAMVDPNAVPQFSFPPIEKTKGTIVIAFGRFNPPTIGHQLLMDTAANTAMEVGGDYIIVPSRTQDKKKNPLDPDTKISFMRKMFPDYSEKIVNDPNFITIFDVLKKAYIDGYAEAIIIAGSDRVKEFEKLANNYNNQLYQFDNIQVISAGDRDPDGKGLESVSASRLRLAAAEGDIITFRDGLPPTLTNKEVIQLFDLVRQGMQIQEIRQEGYNIWEIAPKFDPQSLRENYINKNIFHIGQIVENLNTGLRGKIIRRGTNYLICVTENGMMFKSWIKDVSDLNLNMKLMQLIS